MSYYVQGGKVIPNISLQVKVCECLKITQRDNGSACPVMQSRLMSKQCLIKMLFVRSKFQRPFWRPSAIIFFQSDMFSVGVNISSQ